MDQEGIIVLQLGAVLLLTLLPDGEPTGPQHWIMKTRQMGIPFRVDPNRRDEIKLIILYVSTDEGKSWTKSGEATPDKDGFKFEASKDGMHWFAVQIVYLSDSKEPADLKNLMPMQHILIDTVAKPADQTPDVKDELKQLREEMKRLDQRLKELEIRELRQEMKRLDERLKQIEKRQTKKK